MRQPDSLLDDPASDWFALSGFAGRGFDTRRADAIKLEGILANSGDLDLTATDGPTGYWGSALDTAVRRYQKRNGLAVDGWLRPGGPTIAHMRDTLGPLLDGFAPPTPDEIDAHHASLDRGEGPLIAASPQFDLAPIPGLPDIGEAGRGSNAGQIDWLLRNRTGLGTVPAQFARYVTGLGDEGLAQARDFVAQYAARRPADNDALVAGILRELPDDGSRSRFLGKTLGGAMPAGIRTMDFRPDRDGVPQIRMRDQPHQDDATAEATPAADPQTAQAPAPAPTKPDWYNDVPAYRADVFADAKQKDAWNAMRDTVAGNARIGEGQRAAYMSIFAAEGGMKTDEKSGAVAGLMPGFIEGERKAGRWPADLAHVEKPADLKPADVPRAMQHYFDTNLAKIGGAKALDTIPDPRVAAAVADTLYRDGPGKGAEMVQTAIKEAGGPDAVDGVFGSRTLDAVRNLSADPDGIARLLGRLAVQKENENPGEIGRNSFYRFR